MRGEKLWKIIYEFLAVCALYGCQSNKDKSLEPTSYIYYDKSQGTASQNYISPLDDGIEAVEDLQAASDVVLIGKIEKINWAEKTDERFRTPMEITCLEVFKGEKTSLIYIRWS